MTLLLDRGWLLLIRDLGLDVATVLAEAGLPADSLEGAEHFVTIEEYFRLWTALEVVAGVVSLPIRLAEVLSVESFHPALFAALCSPNLIVATERIGQYKRLVAPMRVTTTVSDSGLVVRMSWLGPPIDVPGSLAVTELVMLAAVARIATRCAVCPTAVVSPYPMEPLAAYEEYFGVRPVHGREHGMTFSLLDAERPFLTESASMWRAFEPNLRSRLSELDEGAPLSAKVRAVLLENLPRGEASIEAVARRLGVAPRTLQRRLRPDTTFKEIVRKTRQTLAEHYLEKTELAHAEISFLVGFEDPNSFSRAFREWTGRTPEEFRRQRAQGDGGD